jgi:glycosyltransferase involved in cell wall biosynthesis
MRFLFVHQNFPGQYRHLAAHLAAQPGNQVAAVGEKGNLLRQEGRPGLPGVRMMGYEMPPAGEGDRFTAPVVKAIQRGKRVAAGALHLRKSGFRPDVIFAHNGWGEALFLKDVFPDARVLLYCEFFYNARGGDTAFDPEFPPSAEQVLRLRVMNAPLLMALDAADWGVAPTRWQKRQFPRAHAGRISVIHDGIDTDEAKPGTGTRDGELITFAARNLEPYRGFHSFMRAIPEIQKRRPGARIAIVGGDEVSYSLRLREGETWRARLLRELEGKIDLSRVTFTGRLPRRQYLELLQKSAVHVYLTYPFVLSWSMLEAMAAGCLVVGSRTPPVEEVIRDGENGLLADFLSPEAIAARVDEALAMKDSRLLRERARATVIERYDLKRVCLPAQLGLVARLQKKLDRGEGGVGVEDVDALEADTQSGAGGDQGMPGRRGVAL